MRRGREGAETAADMTITASIAAATACTVAATTITNAPYVISGTAVSIPNATNAATSHVSTAFSNGTVATHASTTATGAGNAPAHLTLSSVGDVSGSGRAITSTVEAPILISSNESRVHQSAMTPGAVSALLTNTVFSDG
ncbi:hypothetical protein OTU49_001600 [Cherax quadricarinatus]|uniref:Uncharacterized protein n=1 Tax=Cherax quadricarinatus TaxID=27406 RepID=A0AAW0XTG9_CHEQU